MGIVDFGISVEYQIGTFHSLNDIKDAIILAPPNVKCYQRFPTDPIGNTLVTLIGVPAGCEIRINDKDSNPLAGTESCSENPAFSWPVYSQGSVYNIVRIMVISVDYKLVDFIYTSSLGTQSIPIQMDNDIWFNDPV